MRQSLALYFNLVIFGLFLSSCDNNTSFNKEKGNTQLKKFDLVDIKSIIQTQTKLFTEAHLTKDTAFLNSIFAPDARVFPPNSELVSGLNDISKLNYDWVNFGIHEFNEETTSIYGNEEYIIDEGTYFLRYGTDNTIDKGKYINIWKNINGEWKIFSNIWNSNLPVEIPVSK